MGVERLTAGQAFHRTVQSAFLAGLAGASGFRERQWRLIRGSRGRLDLAVEVDGDEQILVIIEIKGTDWDAIPADHVMRNLRRHLCQLRAYLDTAIEDMEAGRWEGIVGALLYPSLLPSPTSAVPTGPRSAGLGTCPSQPCRATESRQRRTERPPGGKIVSSVAPVLLPVAVTVVSNDTLFGRLMSAACSSSAGPQVNARHVPGSSAQVCS